MEIKACPFCGNEKATADSFGNVFFVKCEGCNACGPDEKNEEEAIERWNSAPRKEDAEMEKSCGNCKYLWYCTKALEDEYSSCKSWAPYNPFGDTHATACDNCQYGYRNDDKYYCGKAIGNLDYCCTDWEAKEPEPALLNSEDSSVKPFIDLARDELDVIQTLETKVNEYLMAAEEAAELAQAMLKYCRACGHGSWTPVNPKDATDAVIEEYADLLLAMEAGFPRHEGNKMFYNNLERVYQEKAERWAERLKEAKDE